MGFFAAIVILPLIHCTFKKYCTKSLIKTKIFNEHDSNPSDSSGSSHCRVEDEDNESDQSMEFSFETGVWLLMIYYLLNTHIFKLLK